MLPRALLLALALAPLAPAFAQTAAEAAAKDDIINMSSETPEMRKAFAKAAATLPEFLKLAASPKEGTSGYALKVAISDGRNTEFFWVNNFSDDGKAFSGVLNNQPRLVKKHKMGERIGFKRSQVVDWTYLDTANHRMFGNFTACALLSQESEEDAEAFMEQYGLSCDD